MNLTFNCIVLISALVSAASGPVALDNGKIRIELDSRTFSVRFVGVPGGRNFLEPVHLTPTELDGRGWIEPGGLVTDVLPTRPEDVVLRRGPAELIEREDDYVLLLGPEQPESHWRVKKEVQLARDTAALTYKVTVLSSLKEERDVRIRNTARIAWSGALLAPVDGGPMKLVRGRFEGVDKILKYPEDSYVLPLRAKTRRSRAVLASPASELTMNTEFGVWTRRLEIQSALEEPESENRMGMMALLDDDTHIYESALEGAQSGVNVGAPLVVIEHWTIGPPAAIAVHKEPVGDEIFVEELP